MPMSGMVLAGRYELGSCVAIGGMGEVWRGRDLLLGRPIAVKLLRDAQAADPLAAVRFHGEARCAARVCHPGVVRVYDYCAAGRPFLVQELVDGPCLAVVLARGPLDPDRALDVTAQVAGALSAVHAAGIVHQDVKPANLLAGPAGKVKLADFGIAQMAGSAALGSAGTVSGTAAYLAPELHLGEPASPASDLYALGVVLFECLAGQRPFGGTAMAMAHQLSDVPPLRAPVPAAVRRFVVQLMAKDPAARPADAQTAASIATRLRSEVTTSGASIIRHEQRSTLPAITLGDIPRHDPDRHRRHLQAAIRPPDGGVQGYLKHWPKPTGSPPESFSGGFVRVM